MNAPALLSVDLDALAANYRTLERVGGAPVHPVVKADGYGLAAAACAGRLMAEGASTLNARTVRELTLTLPNHTSIVTGRRVAAEHGGHGVFWNDERLAPSAADLVQRIETEPVQGVILHYSTSNIVQLRAGDVPVGP